MPPSSGKSAISVQASTAPTPVASHNALFPTYKTARVHHAARRRRGVAAGGVGAAGGQDASNRRHWPPTCVSQDMQKTSFLLWYLRGTPLRTGDGQAPRRVVAPSA